VAASHTAAWDVISECVDHKPMQRIVLMKETCRISNNEISLILFQNDVIIVFPDSITALNWSTAYHEKLFMPSHVMSTVQQQSILTVLRRADPNPWYDHEGSASQCRQQSLLGCQNMAEHSRPTAVDQVGSIPELSVGKVAPSHQWTHYLHNTFIITTQSHWKVTTETCQISHYRNINNLTKIKLTNLHQQLPRIR